jgi:hypothetical protein
MLVPVTILWANYAKVLQRKERRPSMDPGGSHLNVLAGTTSASLILIKLDRRALFSCVLYIQYWIGIPNTYKLPYYPVLRVV